ncbi:major intrinsically disordered NOTCH2-binding receptor 1-like [Hyla sarda]|uniref:major intrinsically disordered NOTCH2-binding receptor 1-like n=1 Tax=Hyla sarda TaxID=327740 RepID=UPI0024C2438B|nr:major intrinsically disordered NOTCH2-binding receptor 1-like [Hyla sarda]
MDLSVLQNNNHPDKFLRLDVKTLLTDSAAFHARKWHNKVYLPQKDATKVKEPSQSSNMDSPVILDKRLVDHFSQEILNSTIKSNPLYMDIVKEEKIETKKKQPSWTIQDYDSQLPNPKFSLYLKENPNDLRFWLEDIYTPGYDSLLKKKEKEKKNSKYCKLFAFVAVTVCILIAIVTVCILFT